MELVKCVTENKPNYKPCFKNFRKCLDSGEGSGIAL